MKDSLSRADEEFESVYQRNVDTLYRLCRFYLRNASDADDAVQTAFLKLIKSDKHFESLGYEKAWLIKTAKNYCMDVLKSRWKTRSIGFDDLPRELEAFVSESSDLDLSASIYSALLSLPPKYKEVLYLYYYEGYSIKEMSQMLGRFASTIQTQLAKGRALLKLDLGGNFLE